MTEQLNRPSSAATPDEMVARLQEIAGVASAQSKHGVALRALRDIARLRSDAEFQSREQSRKNRPQVGRSGLSGNAMTPPTSTTSRRSTPSELVATVHSVPLRPKISGSICCLI
jgi:hypothetical protein